MSSSPMPEFASVTVFDKSIPTRVFQGVQFIAMRPLVESIGLAWKPQFLAIKRRYSSARVIPFREGDGRYCRLLGLPLGQVREWAYSINLKKISSEPATHKLLAYRAELDRDADVRSRNAVVEARVARLGETYRHLPLCQSELKMLNDMKKFSPVVDPLTAHLGYRFVLEHSKRELNLMILMA